MSLPIYWAGAVNEAGTIYVYDVPFSNFQATAAPTVNDDANDNYAPGSLWVNKTTDIAYICADATVGAAVWQQIGASAGGVSDGDKGDIVVSSSGTVWSFDSGVVTAFARTLLDDGNAGIARATLGLGTAALADTGVAGAVVPFLTGNNEWGATQTFSNAGIRELDFNGFHRTITMFVGMTANRSLVLDLGDADRTLTMTGNATISGTNTGDQNDHGGLTGLGDDDHTQYALLAGRAGGQSLIGGTGSSNNLTLEATSHATKGYVGLAASNFLRIPEVTAPSTPASGNVYLYAKSDGLVYGKDDAGTETLLSHLAATQAEQEAASSTAVPTTPGRQQYHPSAAKGWLSYNGDINTIEASYNVSSVTDNGTGDYTVNWDTDFSDAGYCALAWSDAAGVTNLNVKVTEMHAVAAGSIQVRTHFTSTTTLTDSDWVQIAAFGDQ